MAITRILQMILSILKLADETILLTVMKKQWIRFYHLMFGMNEGAIASLLVSILLVEGSLIFLFFKEEAYIFKELFYLLQLDHGF